MSHRTAKKEMPKIGKENKFEVHHGMFVAFRLAGTEHIRGSWRLERVQPKSHSMYDIHDAKIDRNPNKVTLTCMCGHTEVLWEREKFMTRKEVFMGALRYLTPPDGCEVVDSKPYQNMFGVVCNHSGDKYIHWGFLTPDHSAQVDWSVVLCRTCGHFHYLDGSNDILPIGECHEPNCVLVDSL
jgi:hypothetical protein